MFTSIKADVKIKSVTMFNLSRNASSGGRTVNTALTVTQAVIDQLGKLQDVCGSNGLSEVRCFADATSWGRNNAADDLNVTQVEVVIYPTGLFYLTGEDSGVNNKDSEPMVVDSQLVSLTRLQDQITLSPDGACTVIGDVFSFINRIAPSQAKA